MIQIPPSLIDRATRAPIFRRFDYEYTLLSAGYWECAPTSNTLEVAYRLVWSRYKVWVCSMSSVLSTSLCQSDTSCFPRSRDVEHDKMGIVRRFERLCALNTAQDSLLLLRGVEDDSCEFLYKKREKTLLMKISCM